VSHFCFLVLHQLVHHRVKVLAALGSGIRHV
jgi:hypothetical protein